MNDINKTGSMVDFDRDNAQQVTQYELPSIHLADSQKVIQDAIEKFSNA